MDVANGGPFLKAIPEGGRWLLPGLVDKTWAERDEKRRGVIRLDRGWVEVMIKSAIVS